MVLVHTQSFERYISGQVKVLVCSFFVCHPPEEGDPISSESVSISPIVNWIPSFEGMTI